MKQTKLESLVEVNINIFIGFMVSLTFWTFVIVPVYNLPVSFLQNLEITGLFTILAIARGYVVRRFFNAGIHKQVHLWATKLMATRTTTRNLVLALKKYSFILYLRLLLSTKRLQWLMARLSTEHIIGGKIKLRRQSMYRRRKGT